MDIPKRIRSMKMNWDRIFAIAGAIVHSEFDGAKKANAAETGVLNAELTDFVMDSEVVKRLLDMQSDSSPLMVGALLQVRRSAVDPSKFIIEGSQRRGAMKVEEFNAYDGVFVVDGASPSKDNWRVFKINPSKEGWIPAHSVVTVIPSELYARLVLLQDKFVETERRGNSLFSEIKQELTKNAKTVGDALDAWPEAAEIIVNAVEPKKDPVKLTRPLSAVIGRATGLLPAPKTNDAGVEIADEVVGPK